MSERDLTSQKKEIAKLSINLYETDRQKRKQKKDTLYPFSMRSHVMNRTNQDGVVSDIDSEKNVPNKPKIRPKTSRFALKKACIQKPIIEDDEDISAMIDPSSIPEPVRHPKELNPAPTKEAETPETRVITNTPIDLTSPKLVKPLPVLSLTAEKKRRVLTDKNSPRQLLRSHKKKRFESNSSRKKQDQLSSLSSMKM